MGSCSTELLNAAPANAKNQLNGPLYDAAGNVINDGIGNQPTYDAENRIVTDAGVTYRYDADGARVYKSSGTMYWPGPSGALAETDLTGTINEEYVYFNGARIARVDRPSGTVHYYFSDHLDSTGVITDAGGNVQERYFYFPYGGMQSSTGSDPNHYKFTGKERDTESGLDMFGARYYGSSLGRFMQPDPFNVIHDAEGPDQFRTYLLQPQNWNHYAYTWNNPLRYVDPTGELVYVVAYTTGNEGGDDKFKEAAETRANEIKNSKGFDPKKDTVIVQGVDSFDSFKSVINTANSMEKQFGKVAEVDLFSHAGDRDGPNFNEGTNRPGGPHYTNEQNAAGLESLHINWDASGQAKFFGCYTADFAQWFANAQHVPAYGFDFFSSFSSSPTGRDYRYVFGLGSNLYMTTRDGRPPVRKDPEKPH